MQAYTQSGTFSRLRFILSFMLIKIARSCRFAYDMPPQSLCRVAYDIVDCRILSVFCFLL